MNPSSTVNKQYVDAALSLLGVDKLVLAIHDQSFPSLNDEEVGRGTPYSDGGRSFCRFASDLGFNALQLGPQGKTTYLNPSPYDSTLFSKNDLSISLRALARDPHWEKLLDEDDIASVVAGNPGSDNDRSMESYKYCFQAQQKCLRKAFANFVARRDSINHLWLAFMMWTRQNAFWLERDALFEVLALEHGTDDWRRWNALDQSILCENGESCSPDHEVRAKDLRSKYASEIQYFEFCQFVVHQQHQALRELAGELRLKLYADMQIGFSQRDMWALRYLLLPGYFLGAPPSRTNPDGQPWGYPVLNPDLYFATNDAGQREHGAAILWLISRIDKLLIDFDGIRIDHPHGLICPWVYDSEEQDALLAVQRGARLFESPNVDEHPRLSKFSLVQPEQLNPSVPRYADGWVRELSEEQVARYGILIQIIKDRLAASGFESSDLICEVLSSCPFPLKSVLRRHGLGRFRVTQKAQPYNQRDVYRSDNAQPEDWIMVGTHDTPPIWQVVDNWNAEQKDAWADYLSERLEPRDQSARAHLRLELAASDTRLVEAMFADLFIGPARNVSIFFADLLGIKAIYNEPGVVSDFNWVLSVPNNYRQIYEERTAKGHALNLGRVLALAIHARLGDNPEAMALTEKLLDATVAEPV